MSVIPPSIMTKAQAQAAMTAPGAPFEMAEISIRGIPTRIFKNAPTTTAQVFQMGLSYPDREYLIYEDERVDFSSFGKATRTLAAGTARVAN